MDDTVRADDATANAGTVGHLRAMLARFNVPDDAQLLQFDSSCGVEWPVQEVTISMRSDGVVRVVVA